MRIRDRRSEPVFWPEITELLLAALALFTFSIVIGILNGVDLVDFNIKRILGHVHAGTIGWITTAVLAAALWLFGQGSPPGPAEIRVVRLLARGALVAFPLLVLAFTLTTGLVTSLSSVLAVAIIAAFFAWTLWRVPRVQLSVPHLGFLAALGTSIAGGVIGVLWAFEISNEWDLIPAGGEDAHPGTMVVGFLVPVGLAMAEWAFFFPNPPKATRAGVLQMVFPFLGGVILAVALLVDVPPLSAVAILLEVVGIVIFAVRIWPSARSVDWRARSPARYGLVAALAIVFAIGLAQYFVIRYEADFDRVPQHQLLALDHANFIGSMTNAVFAMLLAITLRRGRWAHLDQVVFVAVNVGLAVFVAGLLGESTWLKRVSTPVMGAGLLIGVVVFAVRLIADRVAEELQAEPTAVGPAQAVPVIAD